MRKSVLLLLALSACSEADHGGATYRVIPDFLAASTAVSCQPAELGDVAVDQIRAVSDTSFMVLDVAQHRITEFGDDLRPLWSLEYAEHGPAGVDRPAAATLVGDSAVAIVARGGLRLVIVDRDGRLIDARRLEFVPAAVATAGGGLLISVVPMGPSPGSLLFRVHDGGLEPLPIPPRPYDDMLVGAMGNQTLLEGLPGGDALLMHQFLAPRAFRVAGSGMVSSLRVPTPDATAEHIGFVPHAPLTRDQYQQMLVPAIALSVDRGRGEVYLLTRSGRTRDGRLERAVIRTDDRLELLGSYTLDAHAIHLAILPRRGAAVVVDDLDRFFLCPLRTHGHAE